MDMTDEDLMEVYYTDLYSVLAKCREWLMFRHNSLKGIKASTSPIHWMYGGIARLSKDDIIDPLLENGYSTISVGYIGLYEAVNCILLESHTSQNGKAFAMNIMNLMREEVDMWKEETGIGFGLYGTPSESLCHRFAKLDKERYGSVENITDKDYYTNSYHVDVREEIDAFAKLEFESQFQEISSGGCISYIEVPSLTNNSVAIEEVVKFIYDNVQYGEFNTKLDYCMECGYRGEVLLDGNNKWYCPNCANQDTDRMNIVRRTCGLTKGSR